MRQTGFCAEQTGKSYEQIHKGRCQEAETHKPAYIAIVGDETPAGSTPASIIGCLTTPRLIRQT